MRLYLPKVEYDKISLHAISKYPEECCGFMVGKVSNSKHVDKTVEGVNSRTDSRTTRYSIDPRQFMEVENQADSAGMKIVGFYHSHPNVPALPSAYDLEHAWPWYSYLILSLYDGKVSSVGSWLLKDDRSGLTREQLVIT